MRFRSLEESMIFHTYNRFKISNSSKDFLESYGESAWFSEIVEIDSESLKAAFISKFQKNHWESFRIAKNHSESLGFCARSSKLEITWDQCVKTCLMRSLTRMLHIRGAVELYWFSADIAGVGCNIFVWSRIENKLRINKESAGLRRNQQESIVMMQLNARNCPSSLSLLKLWLGCLGYFTQSTSKLL